jgi:3-oxoacyl-[acyl-carrier protein] reductase
MIGSQLDILVANAGTYKAASIEDTTLHDFDELFAVNVRAPFFLVQQLTPAMGNGGSIVLISSLASRTAFGTIAAYAATKGAIDTLVKHFAFALADRGIRVNAVAPGLVGEMQLRDRHQRYCFPDHVMLLVAVRTTREDSGPDAR